MRSRARTGWCCTGWDRPGTSGDPLELLEPIRRASQRLHLLGKRKSNLLSAPLRLEIKAAAGNRGETDLSNHSVSEAHVVLPEGTDIGHYVIGAVGWIRLESSVIEDLEHKVAPLAVGLEQVDVVLVWKPKRRRRRHLEGMRGAHGDEVVD